MALFEIFLISEPDENCLLMFDDIWDPIMPPPVPKDPSFG